MFCEFYKFYLVKIDPHDVFFIIRYPPPPAASASAMSPYGQPPQKPHHSMAPATPSAQQITNQMNAMNIDGYGKFRFRGSLSVYNVLLVIKSSVYSDLFSFHWFI